MAEKKTKVSIRLNDNTEVQTEIADFEPLKYASILNDTSSQMVALGDLVVHRGSVTRIVPLDNK